jgi:hypothetical protein
VIKAGIPHVDLTVPQNVRTVLVALKENQEVAAGLRGGADAWRNRSCTLGMLVELGIITEAQARGIA